LSFKNGDCFLKSFGLAFAEVKSFLVEVTLSIVNTERFTCVVWDSHNIYA